MTTARKQLISLNDTSYYHITARCVRRAFLCGNDPNTGKNYEHRRQWIEERIRVLSSIFTIDIAAYAVMSNHYHIVVRLSPEQSEQWTHQDILDRWLSLHKGTLLVQRYRQGETLGKAEMEAVSETIAVYKQRLTDLSWFMKLLNQPLARQANQEDGCKGHFFEARYTSQALLNEEALLACMTYVDLNPVRAGIAETPEASDYTSIKARITPNVDAQTVIDHAINDGLLQRAIPQLKPLLPFNGKLIHHQSPAGIAFSLQDYLQLVDWTGRAIREDKAGVIDAHLLPILQRLSPDTQRWLTLSHQFEQCYRCFFRRRRATA